MVIMTLSAKVEMKKLCCLTFIGREVEKDKAKQRQRRRRHHSSPAQGEVREESVKGETVGEESVGRAVRHIQAVVRAGYNKMEEIANCTFSSYTSKQNVISD